MASANRSPLGFLPIILFHLVVLLVGVVLQQVYMKSDTAGQIFGVLALAGGAIFGWFYRGFLYDIFRSFKSAAVLITLLVLACVMGTMFIQDLDLRRNGTFDPGLAPEGRELPPFTDRNQSTRFALAESSLLMRIVRNPERTRMLEEKVKLSRIEEMQVELRTQAFGKSAGKAYQEAVLGSKERNVDQITTTTFARKHHKFLYSLYLLARSVHLFDIFESWWFAMLLGLIAINVIVGTFSRAPWSVRDFGIIATHCGILIILAGALTDYLVAQEGYIHFTYGVPEEQVSSAIYDQKNKLYHHLPFRVRLDRFATEFYHEMLVERVDWSRRSDGREIDASEGRQSRFSPFAVADSFPIREGIPRVFEEGKIKVTVHEYKPRVLLETDIANDPNGQLHPAIKLGLYNNPNRGKNFFVHENAEPWLFAADPRRNHISVKDSAFEYVYVRNQDEYQRLLRFPPIPDNGELILRSKDGPMQRVRVALGTERAIQLGENSVQIEFMAIESAIGDAKNVNLDARKQRREEPLLVIRVDGKRLMVPRDDKEFLSNFELLGGISFRFDWPNPKDSGVHRIFRVVDGQGLAPMLVQLSGTGQPEVADLSGGELVALGGVDSGYGYLALEGRVRSAVERRVPRDITDEEFLTQGGGSDDHLLAAWADIEITGEDGKSVRRQLTPFDRPIRFDFDENNRPRYWFGLSKTKMARDWFSVLTVVDHDDNDIKSHAVQVNSPLRHGGFRFFQATALPDRGDGLGVSGISVTNNPGVFGMYLGYTVLTFGTCWIFFVRPILDKRRRKRRKSPQEITQ